MSRKIMFKTLALFCLFGFAVQKANALSITTGVGNIRIDGITAGLLYLTQSNQQAFPGCGSDPEESFRVYIGSTFSPELRKAYLALFLTAKTLGKQVKIWYLLDGNSCRMSDAELQN